MLKRASIVCSSSQRKRCVWWATRPPTATIRATVIIRARRARLRRERIDIDPKTISPVRGTFGLGFQQRFVRRLIPPAVIAIVAMLFAGSAQAASLHVVFPQKAEVTVVRGESTAFTLD